LSHIVTIQTKLRDRTAIAAACQRLGVARPVQGTAKLFSGEVTGLKVQLQGWQYPVVIDTVSGEAKFKYRTELESFAAFAAQRNVRSLRQISAALFDQYRAARRDGRSDKSCYTEAIIVKGFLKWCHRRNLVPQDPFAFCVVHKPRLMPKMAPTLDQVDAILGEAEGDRRAQIALLAFTGMRSGELRMLRRDDVDLDGNWINVVARSDWAPKNRRSRRIPIHPRLNEYLSKVARRNGPYFFCAAPSPRYPTGDHHINSKHLNEAVQALARKTGVATGRKIDGLVVHSLRHFFATNCVNAGIPQRVIDAWMGHTGDKSMGSVYYRLGDKESQDFMAKVPF
jgi:integrase